MPSGTADKPNNRWYSVDIREPDGNTAHESYLAANCADAIDQAHAASHRDPGDKVERASFDKTHFENRFPGSRGRTYHGELLVDGSCWVYVADEKGIIRGLDLRLDLAKHSPTGFSWGFGGSGPAQLSLALLAHVTNDDVRAKRLYQLFKEAFISTLPQDQAWSMSDSVILRDLTKVEQFLKQSAA